MATATKKQVEIPQPVLRTRVTLELSVNEAETLAIIMGRCGGGLMDTRRRHTDAIGKALREAGICSRDAYKRHPQYERGDEYRISQKIVTTGIQFGPEDPKLFADPSRD